MNRKLIPAGTVIRGESIEEIKKELFAIGNLIRKSHSRKITWQEEAGIIGEIHRKFQILVPNWGATHTAKAIRMSSGRVSSLLRLEGVMIANPGIFHRASSMAYAIQVARRIEKELTDKTCEELARMELPELASGKPFPLLYFGETISTIKSIRDDSVDCVITLGRPMGKTHPAEYVNLVNGLLAALSCVCKPDCAGYIFVDVDEFIFFRRALKDSGFSYDPTPYVWVDLSVPNNPDSWTDLVKTHRMAIYFHRGSGGLKSPAFNACITLKKSLLFPDAPIDMFKTLIKSISMPGDTILDPFCDNGACLIAAYQENRKAIGIEDRQEEYQKAKAKISNPQIERIK